jgi:Skp family chaperone for outer membrane proteins
MVPRRAAGTGRPADARRRVQPDPSRQNYEKFKVYQMELKAKVDPFQAKDTDLKKQGEKFAEDAKDVTLTPDQRAKIEKKLTRLQREVEDNKAEAQAILVKAQERQLQTLYNDVETVARRLAKQRGFDLVMHFNDAEDRAERNSPANIARKMQAGALMPMVVEPGTDLSEAILEELHKDLKRESL